MWSPLWCLTGILALLQPGTPESTPASTSRRAIPTPPCPTGPAPDSPCTDTPRWHGIQSKSMQERFGRQVFKKRFWVTRFTYLQFYFYRRWWKSASQPQNTKKFWIQSLKTSPLSITIQSPAIGWRPTRITGAFGFLQSIPRKLKSTSEAFFQWGARFTQPEELWQVSIFGYLIFLENYSWRIILCYTYHCMASKMF